MQSATCKLGQQGPSTLVQTRAIRQNPTTPNAATTATTARLGRLTQSHYASDLLDERASDLL